MRVTTALCATRRDVCERRCKDSASGLSQQSGEAEGSLIPEAGEGGSSPDKGGTGRYCQTVQGPLSKTERRNASEPVVEPPQA